MRDTYEESMEPATMTAGFPMHAGEEMGITMRKQEHKTAKRLQVVRRHKREKNKSFMSAR